MEKIRLGKTDMMLPRLGFGGIPVTRPPEDEAIKVVRRCLDLGITYFDTARGYTTSEERIGKGIAGRREGLIIATKSHSRGREGVEKHLKASLENLRVETIDLYQLHDVSDAKALERVLDPKSGPLPMLEELKKKGVIKHIGITSHQIDIAKEAVKSDRFETILFPFNFVTDEAATELLPLCRQHDVGFICMKPLGGGMLDNITIAFKYLLQFPDVLLIPGIEKASEMEEDIRIVNGPKAMTEAEKQEMERLKKELGTSFCHRCDYCLPCPEEINIQYVMVSESFIKRQHPERVFSGMFEEIMQKAALCTQCGQCETRCPYHLPIMKTIAKQTEWYPEAKRKYQEQLAKG